MKIAFLGTSEFAVPALQALVDAGHDVVAVYARAPKPAGRGQQERKTPVHRLADTLGLPVRTPKTLKTRRGSRGLQGARPRCGGGRVLRPYPDQAVPRRAGAGLHQHPRLAAAALARRRADPSRDPRRRRRDRRHHHAHGRRPRHRPDAAGGTHADLRRRHGGERARPAGGARRDADRLDARRADAPLDRSDAAARAGRHLRPQARQGRRRARLAAAGGRARAQGARLPSLARHVVRVRRRAHQGAGRGAGAGRRRAGHGERRARRLSRGGLRRRAACGS